MMDVGVAKPKAQGQAIINTAITFPNAPFTEPGSNKKYHPIKVAKDIIITIGTKIPVILSAICWIGAFEAWASSTIDIMLDNAVSATVLVSLVVNILFCLIVLAYKAVTIVYFFFILCIFTLV